MAKIYLSICFLLYAFITGAYVTRDIETLQTLRATFAPARDLIPTWFNQSIPPCQWFGISCAPEQTVQGIELSGIPLNCPIPICIGRFTSLKILKLNNCQLFGKLPGSLGHLMNLRFLDLSGNRLYGKLPKEIFVFKQLTFLDISLNQFEGELPAEIGDLTDLKYLYAINDGLSGHIPADLGRCKNLAFLDLSFNSFSGDLPEELRGLESISSFTVEGNHLSGPIANWITAWTMVNSIRLGNNLFSGSLPPLKFRYLTEFSADANQLSGEIPPSICEAESLSHLDLSLNQLTGSIEHTFRGCSKLTFLVLMVNNLYGEIPGYLASIPLVYLELSYNNFSGSLPDQLWESSTILYILLGYNRLQGPIPGNIGRLAGLRRLELDNNLFEGPIPHSIGKLRNLTTLSLHGNSLSGDIPVELFNCEHLVTLDLGRNKLTGIISKAISGLRVLEHLVLSNNKLSGQIPDELCRGFGQMYDPDSEYRMHYRLIDLSYNNLQGRIPSRINNCMLVRQLRLQGNNLTGNIPPQLAELKNLTYLDLSSNSLTGQIFIHNPPLENLQGLFLSNNQLNGSIPSNLSLLVPSLVKLNLSSNQLTGPFPETLFSIKFLSHVDISQNFLSGPISFSGSMSILSFNGSNNHFLGDVSESISGLQHLAYLDLHNNNFNGTLPVSLTSLDLVYLDLSNNNINGAVPCDLCSMVGLSFFNLSGNMFDRFSPECCKVGESCGAKHNASLAYPSPSRGLIPALKWGIISGGYFFFLVLLFVFLWYCQTRRQRKSTLAAANEERPAASTKLDKKEPISINLAIFEPEVRRYTLDGFNFNTEIIAYGRSSLVYKACIPDGRVVAVKRLHCGLAYDSKGQFEAEMKTLVKVKHENLVTILGYATAPNERVLIYKYMVNWSLYDYLHKREDDVGAHLGWPVRLKICRGTARGLAFLHHDFVPHIIHRDIKSKNILLDEDFEPRISDFGLARIISDYESHLSTISAGTPGYIPPEYQASGMLMKATTKGDVYSFGVVVLELVTGKPVIGEDVEEGGGNLLGWLRKKESSGMERDLFDPRLSDRGWLDEMMIVLTLAKSCTADSPSDRPSMLEVLKQLAGVLPMEPFKLPD